MQKEYNKLVRDRIPAIIRETSGVPRVRELSAEEFQRALDEKLREEVAEYLADHNPQELCDILEVLYAAAVLAGLSPEELERMRAEKAAQRGGFARRLFLETVEE